MSESDLYEELKECVQSLEQGGNVAEVLWRAHRALRRAEQAQEAKGETPIKNKADQPAAVGPSHAGVNGIAKRKRAKGGV